MLFFMLRWPVIYLFLVSSVIVHACIRMSIHKSLMLSHFNCSIMTTTTCKNQEGYNKVGEIYEVIEEDYSEVVANVLDVFVKYKEFYPVLVEVSGMCRTYWEKKIYINILSIDKRGSWPHFCFWTQGASRGLVFQILNISGTFMQTPFEITTEWCLLLHRVPFKMCLLVNSHFVASVEEVQ